MMNQSEKAEILAACASYGYTDFMSEKAMIDAVAQTTVADVQVRLKFNSPYSISLRVGGGGFYV